MKKTGYERQEKNGTFWTIDEKGEIFNCYDVNTNADKMYNTANYYSNKTVAINNARADNLMRQLRRFAAENNDKAIDWENRWLRKYYIIYDYERKELDISYVYSCRTFGEIYFSSEQIANKALTAFHNELMWYFTEYCDHVVEDKDESVVEGCDLCKSGNLDNVGINNKGVWFGGRNAKIKDNEKIKFCPQCGRRLD